MSDLTQLLDIRCRCPESPRPPSLLLFSLWEASGFSISCSSILSTLWPSFQVTVLPGVQSVFGISPCFEWEEGVSAAFIVLCFRCHWALWHGLMIIWLMRMMVCPLVMFVCETLVTADCVLTSSAVCQPALPECDCTLALVNTITGKHSNWLHNSDLQHWCRNMRESTGKSELSFE